MDRAKDTMQEGKEKLKQTGEKAKVKPDLVHMSGTSSNKMQFWGYLQPITETRRIFINSRLVSTSSTA